MRLLFCEIPFSARDFETVATHGIPNYNENTLMFLTISKM